MFYGSGAGKLPTASAVVADMVEIAKFKDTNLPMEWRPEKLELADYKMVTNRFFVRTKADEAAVKNAFGAVEFVAAEGVNGELGFVTEEKEWVLDQFAGSFSLGEAALSSERNAICIEINEEYFEKGKERLLSAKSRSR